MTDLPQLFTERISRQLGDEMPAFLNAMKEDALRGIRMNCRKPFDGMETYTYGKKIPWAENSYYLSFDSFAGSTVFHEAGAFYLQEPSAMIPVEVLDPQPGESILDLCAAPGGKSTQIGQKMNGKGLLVCNEPVPKRALILSRNIERIGITNSIVTNAFPESFPESWNGFFDGILVDAPCSGEGMFRRDPQTRDEWSPGQAVGCVKRQEKILEEAARMLKPGGRIVYSTCTYNPDENENVIFAFLEKHRDFSPVEFRLPQIHGKNGMFLCLPHRTMGEGQFTALLKKSGKSGEIKACLPFRRVSDMETEWLNKVIPGLPPANGRFGDLLVMVPECPDLKGIRILRAGLHIAEIRGKNITPAHSSALSCFCPDVQVLSLTAAETEKYIAGAEISGDLNGWGLLSFGKVILGWGKGSCETVKNHYPKGLRKEHILTEPI